MKIFSKENVLDKHQSYRGSEVDGVYYQHTGRLARLRNISVQVRASIYALFLRELYPTVSTRILDIGVSDDDGPETNMLEQKYPWPENLTCAGLGNGELLLTRYPRISYVKINAGEALPFPDKSFDIVYSNAVLEHVGGKENRVAFLKEAIRVGRSVFITVPNRWFPIEHHTAIPFLHWNARLYRFGLKRTRYSFWSDLQNLDFLSKRMLQAEWPEPKRPRIFYAGLPLGPFSSNLVLVATGL